MRFIRLTVQVIQKHAQSVHQPVHQAWAASPPFIPRVIAQTHPPAVLSTQHQKADIQRNVMLYSSCTPPTTGYTSGTCTATGAIFYRSSQSGYITACGTTTTCTPPSTMYTDTATDCSIGPLYVSSTTGYTYACQACNTSCSISDSSGSYPLYGDPNCSVAFYSNTNTTGYTTNCSKIQIAKRAIFSLMNASNSGTLTSADVNSLGVRLGYMNYYNCESASAASTYSYPTKCQSASGASDASL